MRTTGRIDKGGKHYDIDLTQTKIITVHGRAIAMSDEKPVYADNNEPIIFD